MGDELHGLDPVGLGKRLRLARDTANLTQQEAADASGMGRTTLLAIERGQRRVRLRELQGLAKIYGTSVNALLRREAVHVDLVPRFRSLPEATDVGTVAAAQVLGALVKAESELENILGISRPRNYPAERPLLPGDVRAQAEEDAFFLRTWLGLGEAPVQDLFSVIEHQLGIRVYSRPLASKVSGLFAYDPEVGACVLVNSLHRRDRRNQTGAHELGHFMSTRNRPEVYRDGEADNSREERYAQAFGRAFLTPARSVMQHFKEMTLGSSHLTRRHIVLLANHFGVSRQALVMRLEELALVKKGTWAWFEDNGGITDDQARQVLGEVSSMEADAASPQSSRLYLLAIAAWKQALITEGQMSQMLGLGRIEVRELVDEAASEGEEVNDLFKLPE